MYEEKKTSDSAVALGNLRNKTQIKTQIRKKTAQHIQCYLCIRTPAYEKVEKAIDKWLFSAHLQNILASGIMVLFLLEKQTSAVALASCSSIKKCVVVKQTCHTYESTATSLDNVNKWIKWNWGHVYEITLL